MGFFLRPTWSLVVVLMLGWALPSCVGDPAPDDLPTPTDSPAVDETPQPTDHADTCDGDGIAGGFVLSGQTFQGPLSGYSSVVWQDATVTINENGKGQGTRRLWFYSSINAATTGANPLCVLSLDVALTSGSSCYDGFCWEQRATNGIPSTSCTVSAAEQAAWSSVIDREMWDYVPRCDGGSCSMGTIWVAQIREESPMGAWGPAFCLSVADSAVVGGDTANDTDKAPAGTYRGAEPVQMESSVYWQISDVSNGIRTVGLYLSHDDAMARSNAKCTAYAPVGLYPRQLMAPWSDCKDLPCVIQQVGPETLDVGCVSIEDMSRWLVALDFEIWSLHDDDVIWTSSLQSGNQQGPWALTFTR